MSCKLPVECLNEIFEHLEKDNITLHSCLLVNRLWCKVSVEILWRDIWNFTCFKFHLYLRTLFTCLPDESKDLLYENGVHIPTPISKSPLFNYSSFCKVLSIPELINNIDNYYEYSNLLFENTTCRV